MRDERLKAQLFRFVDVLPTLTSARQITRHLREYIGAGAADLPWLLRLVAEHLPENGVVGTALASTASFNARRMAHRFIAATNLSEAALAALKLRKRRLAFYAGCIGGSGCVGG